MKAESGFIHGLREMYWIGEVAVPMTSGGSDSKVSVY